MNKAIFVDRDGTINHDSNYVYKVEDLIVLRGAKEGLSFFKSLGYLIILVTNQSGIAKGYYTQLDTNSFNKALEERIGIEFDKIFICPHKKEENCFCRKPLVSPEIWGYINEKHIDLNQSYMIGDKDIDIEFGKNLNCMTVRINSHQYEHTITSDYIVKDILDFATIISG